MISPSGRDTVASRLPIVGGVNGSPAPRPARTSPPAAVPAAVAGRLRSHLDVLYPPEQAADVHWRLCERLARFTGTGGHAAASSGAGGLFDERDVWAVAYGDMVRTPGERPLRTLRDFLDAELGGLLTGLHLLPIHPSTSDDGFAVADHRRVDPRLGDWDDVAALAERWDLMLDAVVNHVSASHPWVRGWARGEPACRDVVVEVDPRVDLSAVTRPRTTPLRTPVDTVAGRRHVWTTFSADQVDLNFANPEVLLAVTDVLLGHLEAGATRLRLDAVAFLWKRAGTACVHLPETHELVRLWRTVVDAVAPGVLLVAEANVPEPQNVAYLGDGTDEAHLVYRFPLAPLVLHAFHRGDATTLGRWLARQVAPGPQTTFLNFLDGHDGIGLRPVEGLLADAEVDELVARVRAHGGGVSVRAGQDGSTRPYELNALSYDVLTDPAAGEPTATGMARFMAAQSIVLATAGIPALYLHALLGSSSWHAGVAATGRLRASNREKLDRERLAAELADPAGRRRAVLDGWRRRLRMRRSRPAFHPHATQRVLAADPGLLVIERAAAEGCGRVLCVHNVTGRAVTLALDERAGLPARATLADPVVGVEAVTDASGALRRRVAPYGVAWLDVPAGGPRPS